jgi:GT2 family glycosyltransferase
MITFPDARAPLRSGVPWRIRVTPTKGLAMEGGMTGWAFALKAEAFRSELPLIDERLKFYSGDRDLVHSVEMAGYRAARVDGLPCTHQRGATRKRRPELKEQQDRDIHLWWSKDGIRAEKEGKGAGPPSSNR